MKTECPRQIKLDIFILSEVYLSRFSVAKFVVVLLEEKEKGVYKFKNGVNIAPRTHVPNRVARVFSGSSLNAIQSCINLKVLQYFDYFRYLQIYLYTRGRYLIAPPVVSYLTAVGLMYLRSGRSFKFEIRRRRSGVKYVSTQKVTATCLCRHAINEGKNIIYLFKYLKLG